MLLDLDWTRVVEPLGFGPRPPNNQEARASLGTSHGRAPKARRHLLSDIEPRTGHKVACLKLILTFPNLRRRRENSLFIFPRNVVHWHSRTKVLQAANSGRTLWETRA